MAHDIFISHSSEDKAVADAVCAALESENIRCWIAPRDVRPGQDWPTAILEAIKSSKIMVLIFSENSNNSRQVQKEVSVAVNSEAIIIPFKIDNTSFQGSLELFLSDTHWLDAMNPPTKEEIDKLTKTINTFLKRPDIIEPAFKHPPAEERESPARQELYPSQQRSEPRAAYAVSKETPSPPPSQPKGRWIITGGLIIVSIAVALRLLVPSLFSNLLGSPNPTQTETKPPLITAQPTTTIIPTEEGYDLLISPQDGMKLIYIPEGNFMLGSDLSDPDAEEIEKPQHSVFLDDFWIDETEVTNAMFEKFVNETGYLTTAEKAGGISYHYDRETTKWIENNGVDWSQPYPSSRGITDRQNHPVIHVSWQDANAYCSWAGRRLPTEAEWEKAARGDNAAIYPWGDQIPDKNLVNFNYLYEDTLSVTELPEGRSPSGVYQMAGNVWEWVADYYSADYYSSSPERNPTGPSTGEYRVIRGGSWNSRLAYIRAANRYRYSEDFRSFYLGFRCATSGDGQ